MMQWFQNLRIKKKILIGFSTAILLLGIIGIMGVIGTNRVNKNLNNILMDMQAIEYITKASRDFQHLMVAERSMIFANTQSEVFKDLLANYEENLKTSKHWIQKLDKLQLSSEEQEILKKYHNARQEWEKLSLQIVDGRKADTREGRRLAIDLSLKQAKQAFEKMINHLEKMEKLRMDLSQQYRKDAEQTFKGTLIFIIIITGIAIIFLLILLSMMNRTITQPVNEMVDRTKELAEGDADLTKRLITDSSDEVGTLANLFNKWIARLQEIIKKVLHSTSEIVNSISEIATGSQDLATRTNSQAASVTQTSTTLEKFTSIVKQNSKFATEATSKITNFNEEVQQNWEVIKNITTSMTEIDKSSKQIGNIMNVINDISFQTNLLALNAAVEAARAGEAGRGFAVVASEVRNLAQKTAESSKTIQEIVTTNINSTEKGMQLVQEGEAFFEKIKLMLNELSDIVKNIETGSKEQSTGIEQINEAVVLLDNVVNQNAELVNEFATTSKVMNANADQLKDLIGQFKTEDGAQPSPPSSAYKSPPIKTELKSKKEKIHTPPKDETKKVATSVKPKVKTQSQTDSSNDDDDFFGTDAEGFEEF